MNKSKKPIIVGTLGLALLSAGVTLATDRDLIKPGDPTLDYGQIATIALANVPGTIHEIELEKENGQLVWDVEIVDESSQRYELLIDANSGAVLSRSLDDPKDTNWEWFDRDSDKQES